MDDGISWVEVEGSSNIAAIAYLTRMPPTPGSLYIRFIHGGAYIYENFPAQLAEDFFTSISKGRFFYANIKADYTGVKVVEDQDESPEDGGEREKQTIGTEDVGELTWGDEGPVIK